MEITRKQFSQEITSLIEDGMHFNVESEDTGLVYVRMYGCSLSVILEDDILGRITAFKPLTEMEITIDFDFIGVITKEEDDSFRLELDCMPDIIIRALRQ